MVWKLEEDKYVRSLKPHQKSLLMAIYGKKKKQKTKNEIIEAPWRIP